MDWKEGYKGKMGGSLWAENPLANNNVRIPDPVDPAPAAFKVGDRVRLRAGVTEVMYDVVREGNAIRLTGIPAGHNLPAGTLRVGDTLVSTTDFIHVNWAVVPAEHAIAPAPNFADIIANAPANAYGDRTLPAGVGLKFNADTAELAFHAGLWDCAVLTAGGVSRRLVKRGGKPAWIGVDEAVGEYNWYEVVELLEREIRVPHD